MRSRHIVLAAVMLVVFFVWVLALSEYAGNTDPTNPPGSTSSYTLEDIYNRLINGTTGPPSTFTEPTSGPGSTMHTLNDIMDKAPFPDNTDGATAAQVLTDKTFWGLRTDGSWGKQTGTMPNPNYTRVPKTGQTVIYLTGDDGDYQLGVLPVFEPIYGFPNCTTYTVYGWGGTRFTDNGDGMVTDNLTGLMWTKNADHGSELWDGAIDYCNGYSSANYADWRLPNINELKSIIDTTQAWPALPAGHPFDDVLNAGYWSSTTYTTNSAWYVILNSGLVGIDNKDSPGIYVWPVRGGY